MKNLIILLFCCAFVLSGADLKSKALFPVKWQKNAPHEPLKLVENGKLNFVIVYDEKSEPVKMLKTRKAARIAAYTIADAFERTTGKKPLIVPPGDKKIAGFKYVIAVGKTPYSDALKLDPLKMPKEGYTLATFDKGIVICGFDGSLIKNFYHKLDWYRYRFNGTANGAFDFCERFLGMRYYYPGIGVYAPVVKNLAVESCRYSDAPYFKDRFNWAVDGQFKRQFPWKGVKNNYRQQEHSYRMAISTRYQSGHSPDPQGMAKTFPDKIDLIFFKDKFGHRYYNPSTHIGNFFDITNPEFAKLLVDCFVKYYETDGKFTGPWGRKAHRPNAEYVLFGQCDTFVENLENERSKPHIHPNTTRSNKYTDVYMHFWIALGKEVEKRLPGKKIGFSLYHNYTFPPVEKYTGVPQNLMPKLDVGTPAFVRHKRTRKVYTDVYKRWTEIFGHPINGYFYGVQTNAYSKAIQGAYMGELLNLLKPYLSTDGLFLDAGGLQYHFYYSYYPVYRVLWNPDFDTMAALDEHWEKLYGPAAGKTLKKFYHTVKERWEKKLIPSLAATSATQVPPEKLYNTFNLAVVRELEALLKKAEKETRPGSIERQRFEFFAQPWKLEIASSKAYLGHVTPMYKASKLEDDTQIRLDGKMDEPVWKNVPDMKFQNALGKDIKDPFAKSLKILWNNKGIYIGFYEKGKPASVKGDVWFKSDHLEVFLSPGRKKEQYMHFTVNPTGDSAQGARRLKPIEAGYDGKWRCPGFIARSAKGDDFWSCEMFLPFEGMRIAPPKVYTSWFFNALAMDRRNGESYGLSLTMSNNHNINLFGLVKFMGSGD